ncbi:hypothetical protein CDAR_611521 [Caerostris darwini]|uniref:Uncharacterized protein n=1 Tax=Caerostris darwini TaxID=1538125 RepID=A0AAV4U2U2_9ARAC|nr:hypothetical protein CDAR_611521 [Caerostris darwini]
MGCANAMGRRNCCADRRTSGEAAFSPYKTNIYEVPDKRPPTVPYKPPLPCSESGRYRVPDEWWAQMVRSSTDPSRRVLPEHVLVVVERAWNESVQVFERKRTC